MTLALAEQLVRMGRWNSWANGVVFEALRASNGEPPEGLAAFQHILETEVIWLRRMAGIEHADVPLWGPAGLERCEVWATEARERLARLMGSLDEPALARTFAYRNSTGREFEDRMVEPLLHVLLHSSQYRGEAAAFLNASGRSIPDLDFIFWLREGEQD